MALVILRVWNLNAYDQKKYIFASLLATDAEKIFDNEKNASMFRDVIVR